MQEEASRFALGCWNIREQKGIHGVVKFRRCGLLDAGPARHWALALTFVVFAWEGDIPVHMLGFLVGDRR